MRLNEARKKLGGEDENKDVVTVGTKGATALLCADATCLGSRKGDEDEWVLNYNKNLPFAWCLICPDLWVLCGNYPTKRKLITLITLVAETENENG